MKIVARGIMLVLLAVAAYAATKAETFYVYSDKGAKGNHFAPSGWMGDYGDIKLDEGNAVDCIDGKTCIKVVYSAEGKQGANWAGIFWQTPPNNWGEKPGGFDLKAYKSLTFWAKATPNAPKAKSLNALKVVKIAEFKVGGITGTYGDSDSVSVGPVELDGEWKKYTIDLSKKDMTKIIGGFCWSASRDDNPDGFTLYLDEVRFES